MFSLCLNIYLNKTFKMKINKETFMNKNLKKKKIPKKEDLKVRYRKDSIFFRNLSFKKSILSLIIYLIIYNFFLDSLCC